MTASREKVLFEAEFDAKWKTYFFLRSFYAKRGFQVDARYGALVRFLEVSE